MFSGRCTTPTAGSAGMIIAGRRRLCRHGDAQAGERRCGDRRAGGDHG